MSRNNLSVATGRTACLNQCIVWIFLQQLIASDDRGLVRPAVQRICKSPMSAATNVDYTKLPTVDWANLTF
jgi:hypothetical protein